MYRVSAYSNAGLHKETNQDSCLYEVATTPCGEIALLVMCDGVGGLSAGELASASIIHWFSDWFEHILPRNLSGGLLPPDELYSIVQEQWSRGMQRLNSSLRGYGRTLGSELGSTCTALLLYGGRYLICHIGDCRVYRFTESSMEQLTDDQTWVAREVARGNISPAQARNHPQKNVILQSVGSQGDLSPVFTRGDIYLGDVYLVCCDGFRNELFDDELFGAFGTLPAAASDQELQDACEHLARLVMNRGEYDNVSAVACMVQSEGDYGSPILNVPDSSALVVETIEEEPEDNTADLFEGAGEAGSYA